MARFIPGGRPFSSCSPPAPRSEEEPGGDSSPQRPSIFLLLASCSQERRGAGDLLDGELAFSTFADAGQITPTVILGRDAVGVDIQTGVWHSMAVLTPHVVCFEVKPAPIRRRPTRTLHRGHPGKATRVRGRTSEWLARQATAS